MNARNMLNGMIGGNHPPDVWRLALDTYRDQVRAQVLTEAADFLRDAYFQDGLNVQEIGAALRHAADNL